MELKSFTRAVEAMLLSQPTISEHIRSLKLELDQKLVDRSGRTVEPTPVVYLLYGYGRKILRTRRQAVQAIEQYSGKMTGRIVRLRNNSRNLYSARVDWPVPPAAPFHKNHSSHYQFTNHFKKSFFRGGNLNLG